MKTGNRSIEGLYKLLSIVATRCLCA